MFSRTPVIGSAQEDPFCSYLSHLNKKETNPNARKQIVALIKENLTTLQSASSSNLRSLKFTSDGHISILSPNEGDSQSVADKVHDLRVFIAFADDWCLSNPLDTEEDAKAIKDGMQRVSQQLKIVHSELQQTIQASHELSKASEVVERAAASINTIEEREKNHVTVAEGCRKTLEIEQKRLQDSLPKINKTIKSKKIQLRLASIITTATAIVGIGSVVAGLALGILLNPAFIFMSIAGVVIMGLSLFSAAWAGTARNDLKKSKEEKQEVENKLKDIELLKTYYNSPELTVFFDKYPDLARKVTEKNDTGPLWLFLTMQQYNAFQTRKDAGEKLSEDERKEVEELRKKIAIYEEQFKTRLAP